ncbi:MAG: hypothetical protein KatS3mg078_1678 [Deltaproteobacteria bacterium]|nr:MAG: hypothetical protein KatS3mg078_1678 [Deltaproteobacteria bacterium]
MRIGFIYQDALGHGGYPRDVRWLASALATKGVKVTLFCHRKNKENAEGLLNVVEVRPFHDLSSADADVFHVFGILIPHHLLAIGRLLRKPVVVSPMGHLMSYHLRRKALKKALYLKVVRPLLKRVRWFHVFSDLEASSVTRYIGDRVQTFEAGLGVFLAPMGVEGERRDFEPSNEPTRLLFFGRNDVYQKGIDILLEGYAKAIQMGAKATLTIAGQPWGNSEQFIWKFVEKRGLGESVQLMGPVDDSTKWKLLQEVDYLVFLSRWDGPPRPIREAIAVGTPVIVSSETNMGHLVTEFGAGLEVPLNPDEVAKAILRASKEKALWHKHREGVKKLYERLSWNRVAEDYIRGYQRVLESLS